MGRKQGVKCSQFLRRSFAVMSSKEVREIIGKDSPGG